jgi:hypothetical protein
MRPGAFVKAPPPGVLPGPHFAGRITSERAMPPGLQSVEEESEPDLPEAPLPKQAPPVPDGPFRLDESGKGFARILSESCLKQEVADRHRYHAELVQVKKLKDAGFLDPEFVVNESAIAPTVGSGNPVEEQAARKVKLHQQFLAGSALYPEGKRYWSNRAGDVPPDSPPPKPDSHSATPTNAEVDQMIRDVLSGGAVAAKAIVKAACTTPEYIISLPAISDVVNRVQASCSVQAVRAGQEQTFVGADGQAVFSLRGTYKAYGGKEKPGGNTCFSDEWRAKLTENGLGRLVDHIIPKSSKENLQNSLEAHALRLGQAAPAMSSRSRHAFDIASQSYSQHLPALFEEATPGGVPRGWQKVIDNLQHKSSGWNSRYKPLDKKAWAASNDKVTSLEFRVMVAIRLLLRAAAGSRMGTMTDVDMRRLFLSDPKEGFVKQEDHGPSKSKSKRWRIIWNASLVDSVVQALGSYNACKTDIKDFQEPDTVTLHGLGTGHDKRGVEHMVRKVRQGVGKRKIKGADAQGFDMGIPRLGIMLDAERKSLTVSATPPGPESDQEVDEESKEAIHLASSLLFYCDAFAHTCHCINFYGVIWGCDQYGMTASGLFCTGSQNSFFRGFVLLDAGATWAIAVGDDENHTGVVDDAIIAGWGTMIKPGSETEGTADDFSMLSHRYVEDEHGNIRAEYQNLDKMLATNLLMVYRGERIPQMAVAAQLQVLRDTPGAINTYRQVASTFGSDLWSGNVDEDPYGVIVDYSDRQGPAPAPCKAVANYDEEGENYLIPGDQDGVHALKRAEP